MTGLRKRSRFKSLTTKSHYRRLKSGRTVNVRAGHRKSWFGK